MTTQSFTTVFRVDATPDQVFAAVNDVRGWWSEEIEGATDYKDLHRAPRRRLLERRLAAK